MPLDTVELRRILGPTLEYVAGKLNVAAGVLASVATSIRDASGDVFPFGDIDDGEYLVRSGSQIVGGTPTPGGPPTGAAGGDLGGTYPNPTVAQARGLKTATTTVVIDSATAPTNGQVLTASSGTAAAWATPAAGGVTSFNARTGPVTPQSADYTAAQVGAISSANTGISALTLKATPASGDTIPINDGAASNALKRIDVSSLPYIPLTVLTRTGNPWIDAPASPNVWDDEFASGSADLATRGWVIRSATTPFAVLTRVGTIDYTDDGLTSFSTGQYKSELVGSILRLQVKEDVTIAKAIPGPGLFVARAFYSNYIPAQGTSATTSSTMVLGITDRTLGSQQLWNAGGTYAVVGAVNSSSGFDVASGWTSGNHSTTQAGAYTSSISDFGYDVMGQCLRSGFDAFGFLGLSPVQRVGWRAGRVQSATFVPTVAFLSVSPNVGVASGTYFKPSWFEIDYMRLLPSTGWFG